MKLKYIYDLGTEDIFEYTYREVKIHCQMHLEIKLRRVVSSFKISHSYLIFTII